MADILEFPAQEAQGLAYLERELLQLLQARGADTELAQYAARELRQVYSEVTGRENCTIQVALPEGIGPDAKAQIHGEFQAGLNTLSRHNHRLLVQLVAELVLTRVRLYQRERE